MGEVLSFKKLDYSKEVEEITSNAFKLAFWPLKFSIIISLISFLIFFFAGQGNLMDFASTAAFNYLLLLLAISSLWLISILHLKLKCPNCKHHFFRYSKKLQIKPGVCPNCKVIFVKKTHPIEDDYDYSREFELLKLETERKSNLLLFYLTIVMVLCIYVLIPVLSSIAGSTLTIFIITPAIIVIAIMFSIKQLETRCPCCNTFIKWTELKPAEISKHCPHCDARLAK
jgi:Zn finger protein HypA/HybF involved in hydrogenase expression